MTVQNSLFTRPQCYWTQRREASGNWLAFGLLLAAWNAADSGDTSSHARPALLRAYPCVSVRAAQRSMPPGALSGVTVESPFLSKVTKASTNCKAGSL